MDKYIYKNNQKLRYGYTTGSCAAAASKAAATMLLTGNKVDEVFLMTPKGIGLTLAVEEITMSDDFVSCAIRKDAGDDADCTDGILIFSTVSKIPMDNQGCKSQVSEGKMVAYKSYSGKSSYISEITEVYIEGGAGVGRITKHGLEQPIGAAAINRIPRKMIKEAVNDVAETCCYTGGLYVEISVPKGQEIAKKTFNPRLGIEGGISILGTSGIVEPMSEQALIATIHTEMKMKAHNGAKKLLITPGNYGRDFAKKQFNIEIDTGIKCSNFIGDTIDMAYEFQLREILLIGHIGKLVKIAAGIMNTHSKWADGRMEIMCSGALMAGANADICKAILQCITTDDALKLLKENNLLEKTMNYIMGKIEENLNRRAYDGLTVQVIMFSNEYGTLGATKGACELLEELRV